MEKDKNYVLNNLIINKTPATMKELLETIDNEDVKINLEVVEEMVKEIFHMHKSGKEDFEKFLYYQLIFNSIINSNNLYNLYNPEGELSSVFELIKIIELLYDIKSQKYLSRCLNRKIGIVEVNRDGLRTKFFAYSGKYKKGDLIYIVNCQPRSIFFVCDYYETTIAEILPYVKTIYSDYVYHFNLPLGEIARESIKKLSEDKVVNVKVWDATYYCKAAFEVYTGMKVEVNLDGQVKVGEVLEYTYFYDDMQYPVLLSPFISERKDIKKERRYFNLEVLNFFFPEKEEKYLLTLLTSNKYSSKYKIFTKFANLLQALASNKPINLNDEINLYYRPFVNYVLENVDLNTYYYDDKGRTYSILTYLTEIARLDNSFINFLVDVNLDTPINIACVNLYGIKYRVFSYDKKYTLGEPVFINVNGESHIGFIHEIYIKPFNEILHDIAFYQFYEVVQISKLKEILSMRNSLDGKVILAKISNREEVKTVIFNNVPYVGQMIKLLGKEYIVAEKPFAVSKERIKDLDNMITIN